jgi:hypothetical protein
MGTTRSKRGKGERNKVNNPNSIKQEDNTVVIARGQGEGTRNQKTKKPKTRTRTTTRTTKFILIGDKNYGNHSII